MVLRRINGGSSAVGLDGGFASREGGQDRLVKLPKSLHEAVRLRNLRAVESLLSRGHSIKDVDEKGRTALMVAAEVGDCVIANFLISKGADCSERDKEGRSALNIASENGHHNILTLLDHVRGWHLLD